MPITVDDNYWTKTTLNKMGCLMEDKIAGTCKTYHYLTSTSWKHVLSVFLLLEPGNSKKATR